MFGASTVGSSAPTRVVAAVAGLFFLIVIVASMGSSLTQPGAAACQPPSVEAGSVHGVPGRYVATYTGAAERFELGARGPAILAAIHKVETNFGTSDLPGVKSGANSAGATGPMQFLEGTWDRYGIDGDNDGDTDVYDATDAIYGAANYLRASGAPADFYGAIFAYNHADWYVEEVLDSAKGFGDLGPAVEATCAGGGDARGNADLATAVRLTSPRAFESVPARLAAPGYGAMQVDARLYDDVVWVLQAYGLRLTAAREAGHATHGDGTAVDMVPAGDLSSQQTWDQSAGRLAADLGWKPSCGASGTAPACPLVPAIQFIGYDGYPSHGSPRTCGGRCPAHIHVSWRSSSFGSSALRSPASWVIVFPAPPARMLKGVAR